MTSPIRTFSTGATRDSVAGKLRYEGYFSPLVLRARAEYMRTHQVQADGELREPDNWQKGIPADALMDSAFRHFMDWWLAHREHGGDVQEAICALMFNAEAYLHAVLMEPAEDVVEPPALGPLAIPAYWHTTCADCGETRTTDHEESCPGAEPPMGCMGDPDPVRVTVKGSDEPTDVALDEPFPLPAFGPGSPAATTAGIAGGRSYVGEDGDADRAWSGAAV
jgi:hypothetical protein